MDIDQPLDYTFTPGKDNTELNLYIPSEFTDITILNDLLTYVLPAGMSCNIIKELQLTSTMNTNIGFADDVKISTVNSTVYSQIPRLSGSENTDLTTGVLKTSDAIKALILDKDTGTLKAKPGFSVDSEIIKLEEKTNG